jgi:hypothetical protein
LRIKMKIQLYELSFQEANIFLNFKFDKQIILLENI